MEPYYWDGQIEYLKRSTALYYNDDYIDFLIHRVWNIHHPVRIVDFGCGYGHLGLRLLPLLPAGSEYVGVDAGVNLIEHARELFRNLSYRTEFIAADFNSVSFDAEFDLAVCHAVLLHMNDPFSTLKRMIASVKPEGKVAAFEPHWIGNSANFHLDGIDQSTVIPLGQLQELFERDLKRTGKDGNIGLKLPLYFNRLGLRNVQCRLSDKVNIYDPTAKMGADIYEAMQFSNPGERSAFIDSLLERGMSMEEAIRQYECENAMSELFTSSTAATYAAGMKITFGTV
ncbi:trans-aconitate 2-methyltransferase [Paenibacillus sp. XY044]|uniref:class I SAM-dependent methyltransferase n=1 Tax=Paenibacillus sp. XY044 TaxID=2026089 RepID=UPI000B980C6D|nr:class I SAM-dependent methyltransferase [Paenibacillus sp. XY044]OZB96846.1 methyltransferase [Paenibacillus sp. XY044]